MNMPRTVQIRDKENLAIGINTSPYPSTPRQPFCKASTNSMKSPSHEDTDKVADAPSLSSYDFLQDPSYLISPISTILEANEASADHTSRHDVLDAYDNLASRLSSIALSGRPSAALETLKSHSSVVAQTIVRDISAALSPPSSSVGCSSMDKSLNSSRLSDIGLDSVQNVYDVALLSQYALRLLSDILHFSSLHSAFSSDDLSSLLDAVIAVLRLSPDAIPTPGGGKTYALASHALYAQKLAASISEPKSRDIVVVIRRMIDGRNLNIIQDGLKSIHRLSRTYPAIFYPTLSDHLPAILRLLASDEDTSKTNAAYALGGLALAVFSSSSQSTSAEAAQHIRAFVATHSTVLALSLSSIGHSKKTADQKVSRNAWIVTVLSSLIILSGPSVFTSAPVLKLLLPSIGALRSPWREASWHCLVWNFGMISTHADSCDVRNRAFCVVEQELDHGIAAALICALLRSNQRGDTAKIVEIIQVMLRNKDRNIVNEGLNLFARLTSHVVNGNHSDKGRTSSGTQFICEALLDGRILYKVCAAPEMYKYDIKEISPFDDQEARQCWAQLLTIWSNCVERYTQWAERPLPVALIQTWRHLLLLWKHSDRPVSSSYVSSVIETLARFLQARDVLSELWEEIPNHLPEDSTAHIAWGILKYTAQQTGKMGSEADAVPPVPYVEVVKIIGLKLAISVCCSSDYSDGGEDHDPASIRRQLWRSISCTLSEEKHEIPAPNSLPFLTLPLMRWRMSESEIDVWDKSLRSATNAMNVKSALTNFIIAEISNVPLTHYALCPRSISALLRFLDLATITTFPADLCNFLRTMLLKLYPPSVEDRPSIPQFLCMMKQVIVSVPNSLLVSLLESLQSGLRVWIEDENMVLTDDDYNEVVAPMYCEAMALLRSCPANEATLQALSAFFACGFKRIPYPAHCPLAFASFWKETFHGKLDPSVYPEGIKVVLRALDDAYGQGFAEGLSTDIDSQPTPPSVVIDSQPDADSSSKLPASSPPAPETSKPLHLVAFHRLAEYTSETEDGILSGMLSPAGEEGQEGHFTVNLLPRKRLFMDHIELPSVQEVWKRPRGTSDPASGSGRRSQQRDTPSPSVGTADPPTSPSTSFEDCDSWEAPITTPDVRLIQDRALPSGSLQSSAPRVSDESSKVHDRARAERINYPLNSPTPVRRMNKRSQTAPTSSSSRTSAPPLRRTRTETLGLGALQQACALVSNDASQMPVQDLLEATRLVHQMGTLLNEHLAKKLRDAG